MLALDLRDVPKNPAALSWHIALMRFAHPDIQKLLTLIGMTRVVMTDDNGILVLTIHRADVALMDVDALTARALLRDLLTHNVNVVDTTDYHYDTFRFYRNDPLDAC